jgi:formylglycine-generating enzyme required for sulfatase activity
VLQPIALTDAGTSVPKASDPTHDAEVSDSSDAAINVDIEAAAEAASPCPPEMVLVEGNYCPRVEQTCKRYLDYGEFAYYRCGEYEKPAKCLSDARVKMRFCIDREEYVIPGDDAGPGIPANWQSYTMSNDVCHSRGGRNCTESEWQFACEGEDMHPYPYGDGFVRDGTACNIDRSPVASGKELLDLRAPITDYPRCLSPFGVHNMSGNVEEWATKDDPPEAPPMRASMKGAWWLPGKNYCRAATVDHDELYKGTQTGIRCCKDI